MDLPKKEGRYHNIDIPWNRLFKATKEFFNQKPISKNVSETDENQWYKVEDDDSMRREMDHLLDKISRLGYQNLREDDKNRLLYLSNQLSGNKSSFGSVKITGSLFKTSKGI